MSWFGKRPPPSQLADLAGTRVPATPVPAPPAPDSDTRAVARMTLLWTATLGLVLLWVLREIALLVCYAVLLAYALSPLVSALARAQYARGRSLPRWAAAAIVVLTLVALAGWLVAFTFPRLVTEAGRLAAEAPGTAAGFVGDAQRFGQAHGMSTWFDPMLEQARVMSAGALKNLGGTIVQWIGHFLGGVGHLLALALLPLLSFYILAEAEAVEASVTRFLPDRKSVV